MTIERQPGPRMSIPSIGWCRGGRETQEDHFGLWGDGQRMVAVMADGMGGHQHGDLASRWLVEEIGGLATRGLPFDEWIAQGATRAVERMKERGGVMGTTMAAVEVARHDGGSELTYTWVGDSRIYAWTAREPLPGAGISLFHRAPYRLWLLSADDSFVWGFFSRGELSIDQVTRHPFKNQLERSVGDMSPGIAKVLKERCVHFSLAADDRILLCSDGVWESFPRQEEIHACLNAPEPDRVLLEHLGRAHERGDLHDNVSWLILTGEVPTTPWNRLPRLSDDRLARALDPEIEDTP
ncbi:MAG TPA: protein phosphatase 2C domain-containing protein [Candidatus Aminicenantes bacterium]|nr:protein phosphatase 2C domain-containing protein [Candidatus Aminicenantes bacterium]